MRVLMLVPSPRIRGPLPKHLPVLVDALRSHGVDVRTEPWGRRADDESGGAKLVGRARDVARMYDLLRRQRFDVLLVNTSHELKSMARDLPLVVAAARSPTKKVLHFHGGHSHLLREPRHRFFKLVSASLLAVSDGILVHSREEERALRGFRPSRKVHTVRYAIAPATAVRNRLPRAPDAIPTILFASRVIAEKGIFDTIEAFALIRRQIECRLVIAGAGAEEHAVARRVEALGIAGDVTSVGYLTGDELADAYAAADVFVLPTYWGEGFPLAVAEAMRAGVPVVTTRSRGMSDELVDGVHALFVEPRAPRAVANALMQLLRDPALRARIAEANIEKVRDFAPDAVARDYLACLRDIVATTRAP